MSLDLILLLDFYFLLVKPAGIKVDPVEQLARDFFSSSDVVVEDDDRVVICPSAADLALVESGGVPCPVPGCLVVLQNRSSAALHVRQSHGIAVETDAARFGRKKREYACPVEGCGYALGESKRFASRKNVKQVSKKH